MKDFSSINNYYRIVTKLGFLTGVSSSVSICNTKKDGQIKYHSRKISKDFSFRLQEHFETKNTTFDINFSKSKSIALTQSPQSTVYLFDIDTHELGIQYCNVKSLRQKISLKREYKQKVYRIITALDTLFKTENVFIEYSRYNNGIHIYYNFSAKLLIDLSEILETEIYAETQLQTHVDIRTEKKVVRLPFANDYINFLHKNKKKAIEILSKKLENATHQICSTADFIKQLTNDGYILNEIVLESNEIEKTIFTRTYTPEFLIQDTQKTKLTDFSIFAGQRCKMMIKIGFWCKQNSLSLTEYCEIIVNNNVSSKDLTKWDHNRILQECQKIYDWIDRCKLNLENNNSIKSGTIDQGKFYSNTRYITKQHKQVLYKLTQNIYETLPITRKEIKQKYRPAINIILQEMLGKAYLDMLSNRTIKDTVPLKAETKRKILTSTQFSVQWLEKLKVHYEFKNINIHRLYRCIRNYLLIEEILVQTTNYCATGGSNFSLGYKFNLEGIVSLYKKITMYKKLGNTGKNLDPRKDKTSLFNTIKQEKRIWYYHVNFLSSKLHNFFLHNVFLYPKLTNSFIT